MSYYEILYPSFFNSAISCQFIDGRSVPTLPQIIKKLALKPYLSLMLRDEYEQVRDMCERNKISIEEVTAG